MHASKPLGIAETLCGVEPIYGPSDFVRNIYCTFTVGWLVLPSRRSLSQLLAEKVIPTVAIGTSLCSSFGNRIGRVNLYQVHATAPLVVAILRNFSPILRFTILFVLPEGSGGLKNASK